jgi:hypothetical protein
MTTPPDHVGPLERLTANLEDELRGKHDPAWTLHELVRDLLPHVRAYGAERVAEALDQPSPREATR